MLKIITLPDIKKLIHLIGIPDFFNALILSIETEYGRWHAFEKSPRHGIGSSHGVIELMPIADDAFYSVKFVNGHPNNPKKNKLNVVGVGVLADVETGYPLLISEMTLLTAFRTAATSALAAKYLAQKNSKAIGIIGTGAQSEFQVLAQHAQFHVDTVKYFDIDQNAMKKFASHLSDQSFKLIPCENARDTVKDVDIITTATATKGVATILTEDMLHPGLHINGIGGDCAGKTELDKKIVERAKIVVEYLPQTKIEGEIQQIHKPIYAELWELVTHKKPGRENNTEVTLFDSVGFAIEDFATLKFIYTLCEKNNLGTMVDLIPSLSNPKDLFGLLK